jgi:hypothetical protein
MKNLKFMTITDRNVPEIMRQLHQIPVDYADGEGIDLEPRLEFLSEAETTNWIQAWTGNKQLDGAEYRIFAQDGSGGYAAFWCVRSDRDILEQPIVFFGSEGDLGVVASNFSDYLWLLANGIGPFESIGFGATEPRSAQQKLMAFAREHANSPSIERNHSIIAGNLVFGQRFCAI